MRTMFCEGTSFSGTGPSLCRNQLCRLASKPTIIIAIIRVEKIAATRGGTVELSPIINVPTKVGVILKAREEGKCLAEQGV